MAEQPEHKIQYEDQELDEPQARASINLPMIFGAILLLALIIGGVFLVLHYSKNSSPTANAPQNLTADDIRRIFSENSNSATTTAPGIAGAATTSQSSLSFNQYEASGNAQPIAPRNGTNINPTPAAPKTTPAPAPAYTPPATTPAPRPVPYTFQSTAWGFGFQLPPGWTIDSRQQTGGVVFYNTLRPSQWGYVEVFDNSQGLTLDDIAATLQNSPIVTTLGLINFNGLPAIRYLGQTTNDNGIALIAGNKIYYLHGALSSPQLASGFWPLGSSNLSMTPTPPTAAPTYSYPGY